MKPWAVFLRDRWGEAVRLTDGCWTFEHNCNSGEDIARYGYPLHRPKLFAVKRDATRYGREHCGLGVDKRVFVRRYAGVVLPA